MYDETFLLSHCCVARRSKFETNPRPASLAGGGHRKVRARTRGGGDSRGVASTAQATSSSRSAAPSAISTRGFDAGFLDPAGYLMTVHARRREVDDDERRMSGSIHCTALEGYVFFFDARRSHASGARCSLLAGRRFFRNDERQRTPHLCLRVFYHGTYGEINSALIAAGAAHSRVASRAPCTGWRRRLGRFSHRAQLTRPRCSFGKRQAPASARVRSSPLYLDQQAERAPCQGH